MKINRVEIDNFMAIGEVTVDLDSQGLVLIQGENEDDSSQKSNGAGKSTVAEALSWALYNETSRGYSADEVINRTEKKNCRVLVQIVDGDRTYNVIRHRKHHEHKNRVILFDVTDPMDVVDLTLGTDKDTQDRIVKLIGCTSEVFRAAIYYGQESQIDLPILTDKNLKSIVEEAAGIDKMQDAYLVARSRLSDSQGVLANIQRDLQEQERLVAVYDEQVTQNEANRDRFNAESAAKSETTKNQIVSLVAEIKGLQVELGSIDEVGLLAEKEAVEARLRSVDGERAEQAKLQSAVYAASNELTNANNKVKSISEQAQRLKHSFEHAGDSIGSKCGECGHVIGEDDVGPKRDAAKSAISALVSEMRDAKQVAAEKMTAHAAASAALAAFKPTDVSEATKRLSEINAALSQRATIQSSITTKTTQATSLKAALTSAIDNPYVEAIAQAEKKATEIRNGVDLLNKKKAEATEQVANAASVAEIFGPAGIRAHILDTVTPFLNDRTAKYLGTLSDGNISAIWSTLSRTAKGELREKFEIAVSSKTGAETYKGLSGGEKKKVRLATALALQDLVSSRASKPIQLWIGDEIDDAVDEFGLERLMTVLEEKAKEKGTVLIISHNPIRDWVRQFVTVEKKDGKATMTGMLCIDREASGV